MKDKNKKQKKDSHHPLVYALIIPFIIFAIYELLSLKKTEKNIKDEND